MGAESGEAPNIGHIEQNRGKNGGKETLKRYIVKPAIVTVVVEGAEPPEWAVQGAELVVGAANGEEASDAYAAVAVDGAFAFASSLHDVVASVVDAFAAFVAYAAYVAFVLDASSFDSDVAAFVDVALPFVVEEPFHDGAEPYRQEDREVLLGPWLWWFVASESPCLPWSYSPLPP